MVDAKKILAEVLLNHQDHDKWKNSPFEHIKRVSNSKVGEIGQDFIENICNELGFNTMFPVNSRGARAKQNPWDIKIKDITFELKTATEDVSGSFQFNHIRYHRQYDALICLGICPDDIFFGIWSKSDIATNKAGALVSMEKGANASYKLTKKTENLRPIDELKDALNAFTL